MIEIVLTRSVFVEQLFCGLQKMPKLTVLNILVLPPYIACSGLSVGRDKQNCDERGKGWGSGGLRSSDSSLAFCFCFVLFCFVLFSTSVLLGLFPTNLELGTSYTRKHQLRDRSTWDLVMVTGRTWKSMCNICERNIF